MTRASLWFRDARHDDVEAIVALVEGAYRGESSRVGWTTEADLLDGQRTDRQEVEALLATPDTRFLLGFEVGTTDVPVGSLLLVEDGRGAYLGMFAVRPSQQGAGIGKAMLREAERLVRARCSKGRIRMTVIGQREELIAWYVRHGYRATGEREPFPYGDPRFGLPKRPDLYFEVLEKALD